MAMVYHGIGDFKADLQPPAAQERCSQPAPQKARFFYWIFTFQISLSSIQIPCHSQHRDINDLCFCPASSLSVPQLLAPFLPHCKIVKMIKTVQKSLLSSVFVLLEAGWHTKEALVYQLCPHLVLFFSFPVPDRRRGQILSCLMRYGSDSSPKRDRWFLLICPNFLPTPTAVF